MAEPPAAEPSPPPSAANPGLFDEAAAIILKNFWREISREELEQRAVRALLADLDP